MGIRRWLSKAVFKELGSPAVPRGDPTAVLLLIGHRALDQSALETRTNRLREIKQELSTMLERPTDPKVWWEKLRKTTPIG